MFEQTFVNTSAQTRRPWTVAASVVLQTALVAIAFLAPLMHIAALQRPQPVPIWLPPQTLREQPPQPAARARVPTVPTARPVFILPKLQAPTTVPRTIDMTPDAPEPPSAFPAVGPTGPPVLAGLLKTTVPPAPAPTVSRRSPHQLDRFASAAVCNPPSLFSDKTHLSAHRANHAHSRHSPNPGNHRPRWLHQSSASAQRASPAYRSRQTSRSAVALSTDASERTTGRSDHRDRRQLHHRAIAVYGA